VGRNVPIVVNTSLFTKAQDRVMQTISIRKYSIFIIPFPGLAYVVLFTVVMLCKEQVIIKRVHVEYEPIWPQACGRVWRSHWYISITNHSGKISAEPTTSAS